MRKLLTRSIASICLVLATASGLPLVTSAQGATPTPQAHSVEATPDALEAPRFGIHPVGNHEHPWFDIMVDPGNTVHLTAVISNSGTVPATLRTFATNALNAPNGGFAAGAFEDAPTGPTLWVDYPTETFELAPEEHQEIDFTVSVPPGTQPGEYVAALVVQTDESLIIPGTDALRQIIRSTISVEITVPGEMTSGFELGEPVVTPAGAQWIVDVPIVNTGTARVRPQGELVVTTPAGEEVSSTGVEMGSVYGGNTTTVRVTLPKQLPLGDYLVSLSLTDEATGASDSIENATVTLAEPEAEETEVFTVDDVSIAPNGDPVQYADVAATITNNGQAIPTANVTLNVQRDGEDVESYPLAENQALPTGSTDFSQRYIPVDGWQPGTWTFQLVISAVSGDTETILATIDVDDEIVVP